MTRKLTMIAPRYANRENSRVPAHLFDARLHRMLQWRRPHDSLVEDLWTWRLLRPYSPIAFDDSAYVIEVTHPDGTYPTTLFSCHVDTVHREEGKQRIRYDAKAQVYYKDDGAPLGADDGAGVWLLLEMIDARVPGVYVFHRGEECGGIGSSDIARNHSDFLANFKRAVAFDRRGTSDVITHQGFGRCCSDEFAEALSGQLNNLGLLYMPCDSGVFTDTANYTDIIPECTNVSCGYDHEHTGGETLHLPSLFALRDALLAVDWEALPTHRDPSVVEPLYANDHWYEPVRDRSLGRYDSEDFGFEPSIEDLDYDEFVDEAWGDPVGFADWVWTEVLGRRLPRHRQ